MNTTTQAVEAAVQRLINLHFYPDMRPEFQHYLAFAKELETAIRAALTRPEGVAEVGDEYLCRAWGETDMPVAAIVVGLDAVRQFLIDQWLGDEKDTDWCGELTLPPIMSELSGRDWRGEGAWSAEFEIGGISVEQVCDVGSPVIRNFRTTVRDEIRPETMDEKMARWTWPDGRPDL